MTNRLLAIAAGIESAASRRTGRLALVGFVLVYGAIHVSRGMGDFKVYRRAAERLVAGEPIYRLEDPHRYLYAPVLTFVFTPLAALPPVAGRTLWYAVNLWIVVSIFRRTIELVFPDRRAPPGFVVIVLLLSYRFIDNNVGHGQVNLALLWLVLEGYAAAGRGRFWLAGLALATAIATKVVPAILLLQLVLRRQWRFAGATMASGAVLLTLPVVWWGSEYPEVLRQWVAVVVDQAGHYDLANKINQSIAAFCHRSLPGEGSPGVALALELLLHAAFVLPLAALSVRLAARKTPEPQGPGGDELALYLLYSTVASPYSWKYYFANLILPLGVVARRLWGDELRGAGRVLGLVFVLNFLPGFRGFGKALALVFQLASFHFLGVVGLFAWIAHSAFRRLRLTFTSSGGVC